MDILFIRHGHAEHLLDYPNQLNKLHPSLTAYGKHQVSQLKEQLLLHENDFLLVSPTKRTIQTANILTSTIPFIVTPLVGPRMFPQKPSFPSFGCDQIYSKEEITSLFSNVKIVDFELNCWKEGINRIDHETFAIYAQKLLEWCKQHYERIVIVSHDGTITNFRILLGEQNLTRDNFLGEAEFYLKKI